MRGKSSPAPIPRSMPSIDGGVTRAPELLTMSALRNHTASMAYASASVTTPSVRPRSRRAGRPTTMPTPVATSAASSGANGNGMPQPSVRPLRVNAAAPASASWASDTWPAYPVTTTSDRPITAAMNVPITAARQLPSVTSKASRPTAMPTSVGRTSERGRGAWPSRWRTRPPRRGIPAPTTTRATTMTMSGTSSNEPV